MRAEKKIAILGKLQTKHYAQYLEGYEIWSMNKHDDELFMPHVDKWFDLHIEPKKKDADFLKENFPFQECHELVGGKYFVTTSAYLIAYAILQGATTIQLLGMRFSDDGNSRRARELHNVREMIFFAMGRGIKVEIPYDREFLLPERIVLEGEDFDQ